MSEVAGENAPEGRKRDVSVVGVIGLGNMGGGMAATLVRQGLEVWGLDVDPAVAGRALADGVSLAASVGELVSRVQCVITVLPDSPEVEGLYLGDGGIVRHLSPGAGVLCLECSTIEPAVTDKVAAAVRERGATFSDAALGRSPAQARSGELLFMAGADEGDWPEVQAVLGLMGDAIHYCGPVGTGIRTKLVLNLLSQATCQLSAEVVALGLGMGLDRDALLGVMGAGLGANGFITKYWPTKVLAGDIEPGFAIRLSAKDLRHAMAMAGEAGVEVPTAAAASRAVNDAALVHGDWDVSGLLKVACTKAGVDLEKD